MMKRLACLLLALLLLCAAAPLQSAAANTILVPVEAKKLYSDAFEMLDLVNAERTSRGIPALTMDPELLELAMTRAFETAVYWSHTRPDGTGYSTLSSRLVSENNAMAGGSVDMTDWKGDTKTAMHYLMESPGHRANILSTARRSIGIGVIELDHNTYWVQVFDTAPAVSQAAQPADTTAKVYVKTLADPEYFSPTFGARKTSLQAGEQTELYVRSYNSRLPFENISVFSSNPNVASVSGSTVTAHANGTAVLTIRYNNYPASAQNITIEVYGGKPAEPYDGVVFTDVDTGTWFTDAVQWAVESKITTGTSEHTFSPQDSCTRAQAVTFLWRAAGSPKADGTNPFADVKPSDYYYDAVLWAVKNNITNGVSADAFAPNQTCTRAQIVTFLWRTANTPAASGSNPFADVRPNDYYYSAVLWAVEQGITAGMSKTSFGPNLSCTRAQIVTFLYRHANGGLA